MTKISLVVINNPEKEEYLEECLNSICNQSLKDIEIIVANQKLSENNLNICKKYAKSDKRIKIIDLKSSEYKNSYDLIIDNACGEFISFVDSNDVIQYDMCKNMYLLAQQHNVDMVKSAWYDYCVSFSTKDTSLAVYNDYQTVNPKYTLIPLFAQVNEDIWSAIYKTKYLRENNIRYFNSDNIFKAVSFYFKALVHTDNIVITPNAYYYRRQNHKDPSSYSLKKAMSIFSVYEEIDTILDNNPKIKKVVNDNKIRTQFQIYEYLGNKSPKKQKIKFAKKLISELKKYKEKGDISERLLDSCGMKNMKSLLFHDYIISVVKDISIENRRIESSEDRIPIILSADDNYSCFVATTGASVLYHTNSFIEFYILSEGITDENKKKIEASLRSVTNNFSIQFVECNAERYFSNIQLSQQDYVKANTCNRLLFPYYVPDVDRAIYLDVDLIVMDDIRKLWDIDIKGNIFGACPLYVDRYNTVNNRYKGRIGILGIDTKYHYFNSGVLLIDYKKWREVKKDNETIVNELLELLGTILTDCTPDELLLNKFAYLNGGYYEIPAEFNVQTYYSYNYCKKNYDSLNDADQWSFGEYKRYLKSYGFEDVIKNFNGVPAIRHFYGSNKPWNSIMQCDFPIPMMPQFFDFWYYASKTLYFEEIQAKFVEGILSKDRY